MILDKPKSVILISPHAVPSTNKILPGGENITKFSNKESVGGRGSNAMKTRGVREGMSTWLEVVVDDGRLDFIQIF